MLYETKNRWFFIYIYKSRASDTKTIYFFIFSFYFFNKTETYMLQICFPKNASGASTPKHEISDIKSHFSGIIMAFGEN